MNFKHKERQNQRKEFNSEITFLLLRSCFCFSFLCCYCICLKPDSTFSLFVLAMAILKLYLFICSHAI